MLTSFTVYLPSSILMVALRVLLVEVAALEHDLMSKHDGVAAAGWWKQRIWYMPECLGWSYGESGFPSDTLLYTVYECRCDAPERLSGRVDFGKAFHGPFMGKDSLASISK